MHIHNDADQCVEWSCDKTYSRSQKKSTFRLRTVFITVCVFITVAITIMRFYYRLRFHTVAITLRVHYAFTFSTVSYSVPSDGGREYAASGSHYVRGPGLSSCAWKRVFATRACGVRPALRGRRRDRGASARGRVKLAILAVVRVGD